MGNFRQESTIHVITAITMHCVRITTNTFLKRFQMVLQKWLEKQQDVFFNKVRCLSKVPFDRAVVWLPVFTACVKAGNAQPSDIMPLEMTAAQFADAFIVFTLWMQNGLITSALPSSCYLVSEP